MSDLDSDPERLEVAVVLSELGNTPSGSNDIWAGSRGCKRPATYDDKAAVIPREF